MALTSYDDIYECFIVNTGVDTSTLPQTNDGKYNQIHNGIRHYNTRVDDEDTKLTYDDTLELINVKLNDTRLLLLAYCMKYVELENQLVGFEQVWQPFQKEVGQKFYREQISGRENTLERTEKKIVELLTDLTDYS